MKDTTKRKYLQIINTRNQIDEILGPLAPHISIAKKIELINEGLEFDVNAAIYYRSLRIEKQLKQEEPYLNSSND